MTTRTDSTEAMVAQLIRMVSDLQVIVRQQGETIASQQVVMEELGAAVTRVGGQRWQMEATRGACRR